MSKSKRGGLRIENPGGRPFKPIEERAAYKGKIPIRISIEAAANLQWLMLRFVEGVNSPEQMVEHLIKKELEMSLAHLSPDELAVWNALDKAVGRFLKDPKRDDPNIGNFSARTAAELRDRIADLKWPASYRAQWLEEAREYLVTDEWWQSSIHGSGGGDEG